MRRLEADDENGALAVAGAGYERLHWIEQAQVARRKPRLDDFSDGPGAGAKALESHRCRGAQRRSLLQAHPCFDDDSKRSLRADQQAVRARARAGAGNAQRGIGARRGDGAQRFDEVVDVRVERRVVATGSRSDPAAERRQLERLRKVAQREPVRAKGALEGGPVDSRLNAGCAGGAIDFEQAIEMAQVDAYGAVVAVEAARLDASDDARSAAVGDGSDVFCRAPSQNGGHVFARARQGHQVGSHRKVTPQGADHVAKSLAVGVPGSFEGICGHDRRKLWRRLDPRPRKVDLLDRGRIRLGRERTAELGSQHRSGRSPLLAARAGPFVAPAPELALVCFRHDAPASR